MKAFKLLSLILVAVILTVSIVMPNSTSPKTVVASAAETEPVIAAASDFEYILSPKNNPKYVLITKYIGDDTKIIIPDSIAGYPVNILSTGVFKDCTNLTYVQIPATVKTLSGETFAECRSLQTIEIHPDNKTFVSVDGVVFNSDKSTLIAFPNGRNGKYTIPESVLTVGKAAFAGAYKITDINMYNSVSSISASAFRGCFSLKNLRLSDSLAVIGEKAFANCVDLREIHIPGSVSIIGADAFLGDMGSSNDKFYYFTDGIYCAPDSAALDYVLKLGITAPYVKTEARTITDIKSGIQLIDTEGALPKDESVNLNIEPIALEDIDLAIPVRYDAILAYKISLTNNSNNLTLSEPVILNFNNVPENAIISSSKVYRIAGSEAYELIRSPHTPFIATQSTNMGTYAVIFNNDFSMKGDIDGNGIVSSYDARFALCLAAEIISDDIIVEEQRVCADVDSNNVISTADAKLILMNAAGIIDSF